MGITEELRWTAVKLASVGKLAVDSPVTEFLKGSKQVYAKVKGKLKSQTPLDLSNGGKTHNSVLVEEMQAKLEKLQEDMNNIQTQQQSHVLTCRRDEQEHLKHFSEEPLNTSSPEVTGRRKIFIRSRL